MIDKDRQLPTRCSSASPKTCAVRNLIHSPRHVCGSGINPARVKRQVAQSFTLSVSVKIVAGCDDFHRFTSSSPHDTGVGRGPRRGAAPPLPSPLLHPMEERECLVAAPPSCAVSQSCTLPRVGRSQRVESIRRPAEYNSQPSRLRVERRPRPVRTFGDETSAEFAGEDACATPACAQR